MKPRLLILLFVGCPLAAQVIVASGKQARIPLPDATSALSLDLNVATVVVENGGLTVHGIDQGDTNIIAVLPSSMQQFSVHVSAGTPKYPPGFVPPQDTSEESGSYETRYSSDRWQFENTLDLAGDHHGESTQLHFVSDSILGGGQPTSFVPSASYRIVRGASEVTFLDQTVNDSTLTLQNVILRGLHLKSGHWKFHAGYTAAADFANVFIPVEKEFAAGLSYSTIWQDFITFSPGLYVFHSIDLVNGLPRTAPIVSLPFKLNFANWPVKAEIAYGHSWAYAAEMQHDGDLTKLRAHFSDRKLEFPALRSSSLPGLLADISWTQIFSSRLSLVSSATLSKVTLATIQESSQSDSTNLLFKLTHTWSVGTGINYGSFTTPGAPAAKTLNLPQQINYDRKHFGVGFQYQSTSVSQSLSRGNGIRQTLRLNFGRFQIGEFVDWQKDALSVASLYSQVPGLQQELQRLGITAVTPDELSALLQDAAFLESLGAASAAQILSVPRRLQEGGNLTWISSGPRPHQLSISAIASHNHFVGQDTIAYNLNGTYAKQISTRNQVQFSGSLVESSFMGVSTLSPLLQFSLRHSFSRDRALFSMRKDSNISGTVFIDTTRNGFFQPGMPPLPGVVVLLDDHRVALTDVYGRFTFHKVTEGDHRVQLRYTSPRDHYFTSPQDTVVAGGSTVDFGVAFPKTDLWGYVKDDAGNGMGQIKLQVAGPASAAPFVISTNSSGKFVVPDAQSGNYQIQIDPESVPFGYDSENLVPARAFVSSGSISYPTLTISPIRVLTGTVQIYDPQAAAYVPVKDAILSLPKLNRSATTDPTGHFYIGKLPPGALLVTLVSGPSSLTQTIDIPMNPVNLRCEFRISSLDGKIRSSVTVDSQ